MKAISLWQPWASAIACGSKRIETRSWKFPKSLEGQLVAIHASKQWKSDEKEFSAVLRSYGINLGFEGTPPLGGIVAVARLVKCLPTEEIFGSDPENPNFSSYLVEPNGFTPGPEYNSQLEYLLGNYWPGRFGWVFTDVKGTPFIPLKGAQGFFDVPQAENDEITTYLWSIE